jgi:thiol-disulfide isomerase/thioredoxin
MPLEIGSELPSLEGATEWFNATAAAAAEEAKGHPVLVHFWSVSSAPSVEGLPRVAELRKRHAAQGLKVIAVHLPTQPDDEDPESVRDAVTTRRVEEPCAVDNQYRLRDAFRVGEAEVPSYYLFDAAGRLRAIGAGGRGLESVSAELEGVLAPNGGSQE